MSRPLLGVAGFPVAHSRSPQMQTAALAELGLDWDYVKVPVPPELFAETVRALPASGFRGLNVTVPHKEAAFAVADERSAAVEAIGAANTLTFGEDGTIGAENTDATGLLDALEHPVDGVAATVLGAGGSARAAAWALADAGATVTVVNRTAERARTLADELGVHSAPAPPPEAGLLVNCTTVGLRGEDDAEALDALGLAGSAPPPVVVDLVYTGAGTPVGRWAEQGGGRLVDGLEMLVRQGARSLEHWTGRPAPLAVMRAAARGERA